ncbi:MAG: DUF2294 domain-containing protein [Bacteroidetes bacterium]|jgi:uncharacterized protein YbcI|nr:DUF2294 domain-containing protein [Bacteroidota bacterium]
MNRSTGQIEAYISEEITKFEREYMGRGPHRTRTYVMDDIVVVRLEGVLTPAEQQLAKDEAGVKLLKEVRATLIEQAHDRLKEIVREGTGREVLCMHSDISARRGERVVVFTLRPEA